MIAEIVLEKSQNYFSYQADEGANVFGPSVNFIIFEKTREVIKRLLKCDENLGLPNLFSVFNASNMKFNVKF